MPHSIIVEGPDGCGKSTLARAIGMQLNRPVINIGPKPKNLWELSKCLRTQYALSKQGVIFDRLTAISHQVYQNNLNNRFYKKILKSILENSFLIICLTDEPIHVIKGYDTPEQQAPKPVKYAVIGRVIRMGVTLP